MFIDKSFRFRTNVSFDAYQCKTDATACLSKKGAATIGKEKMAFYEQDMDADYFLYLATNGHAFCNLFDYDPAKEYWFQDNNGSWHKESPVYKTGKHKGCMKLCMKADRFFKGAQTVFVDVDYTRFTNITDYLNTLTYKPTCVYMSFSDNKEKHGVISRRFRMVYVFDRVLNMKELVHISQTINDQIVFDTAEPMEDDCGTRISQYMNGVYGNNEYYTSSIIWQVSDFPEEQPENICTTTAPPWEQQQSIVFNENMLSEMCSKPYADFMHYHSLQFEYKYRTEKPDWIAGLYQLTDKNYLQLWWYRDKQVDGQHRRRKLFKNACLRRLMFPEMSPDQALFNLYIDKHRFFDDSDGALTIETLARKVKHAFEKTPEQLRAYCNFEITYWHDHRQKFIVKQGVKTTRGIISSINKHIKWSYLDEVYDRTISLKDNMDRGVDASPTTLYRYCSERNINSNPNKGETYMQKRNNKRNGKEERVKLFTELYDQKLTIRENQAKLSSHGIELSNGTIINWVKKYIKTKVEAETTQGFSWQSPSSTYPMPTMKFQLPEKPEQESVPDPTSTEGLDWKFKWTAPQPKWIW